MNVERGKPRQTLLLMQRRRRGLRFGSEEGNALVETAILLPIFMAFIAGVSTFALALNNQLTLTKATAAGAEYLQTIRTSSTDPCANTYTAIAGAATGLNGNNITVTITINGTATTETTGTTANSCTGNVSTLQAAQGDPVTVSTTYPCSLWFVSWHTCQLSAKVTEYEY